MAEDYSRVIFGAIGFILAVSLLSYGLVALVQDDTSNTETEYTGNEVDENDCVGSDSITIEHFEIDEGFLGGQIEYKFNISNAKLTEDYRVEVEITKGDSVGRTTHNVSEERFSREDCSVTIENFDDVRGFNADYDEGERVRLDLTLLDESGNVVDSATTTTRVTD